MTPEQERAAIVAWLRKEAEFWLLEEEAALCVAMLGLANAIERGDHQGKA